MYPYNWKPEVSFFGVEILQDSRLLRRLLHFHRY